MKKLIILLFLVYSFNYTLNAKTTKKATTVLFNTAKHQLTKTSTNELEKFIEKSLSDLEYAITIQGHTDNIGNLKYNQNLSKERAEEVKNYLMQLGIDEELISIDYLGELDPEKPNTTAKNRKINRRVEVTITTYSFENIAELEAELDPRKTTHFKINPTKETIIKGRKGVKILMYPNTFVYEDGSPVTETVNFELTEALNYKGFIAAGLITKSADDLLESGGMLKIVATTKSGKPVKIRQDNPMVVVVPSKNRKENMEVFTSNKGKEWEAKNQAIQQLKYKFPASKPPKWRYLHGKLPKYEQDLASKPRAPVYPHKVRKPNEPRRESFTRKIHWYELNKEELRAKQEKAYNNAIDRYEERMEKYDRRLIAFNKQVDAYNKANTNYKKAHQDWLNKENDRRDEFTQSEMYQTQLHKYDSINNVLTKNYKREMAVYKEKRKERMEKMAEEMDKLGISTASALNSYVFAQNELSWINVDRFYHLKESKKRMITLKGEGKPNERVLILFKNMKAMLPMYFDAETKQYTQSDFPKKEKAVIFAYKVVNGKPMLCYKEIEAKNNYQLEYQPTSFHQIKKLLVALNG